MILFNKRHPKKGFVYAIVTGKYAGQLFVYIETNKHEHKFLSLPEMVQRTVPQDNFEFGLVNKIIDIVERLPRDIYNTCVKQYRKIKNSV
ncbi:hypothetical protein EB118_03275 [bacterium]|nr:hypothetical protein [bacterium]